MEKLRRLAARIRHVLPRTWPDLVRDKKNALPKLPLISPSRLFPQYRKPYSYKIFTIYNELLRMAGVKSGTGTPSDEGISKNGQTAGDFVGTLERTRGYQMEMFQESLKRNVIVAMDTGSGKTHIAVLRIQAELEKGGGKLCWFLVPNVALGAQQYEVLKASLPPIKIEFLSGGDKVDKWSDQDIWDGVLGLTNQESSVVISTHQVLLDALTHGFVKPEKIGLLIFDEAHHCVSSHPANRIMQDFYHPRNGKGLKVPAILGLTASPVVKAKPEQLRTIETNLNAIARTPIMNRSELLKHVFPPNLKRVIYTSEVDYEVINLTQIMECDLTISGKNRESDSGSESVGGRNGDTSLATLEQTIVDPAIAFESSSETGHVAASEAFESIDPKTGEPYVSEDYEFVDPKTGEAILPGRNPSDSSSISTTSSYDVIDPRTGETYTSPPSTFEPVPAVNNRPQSPPRKPRVPRALGTSSAFESLRDAYLRMDIEEDPYIISLYQSNNPNESKIRGLIATKNTYSQNQVKGLVTKAAHIRKEYGPWATEWYIKEALGRTLKGAEDSDGEGGLMEWNGDEKMYLKGILREVVIPTDIGPIEERLTDKVEKLIEVLLEEYHSEEDGEAFAGLVFVEQRVEVTLLQQILMKHNITKDIFRSGTIVGGAQHSARIGKGIYELASPKTQVGVIEAFRSGKLNLLISTSVVEEGLDIPACHLVVCFSLPPNLKSFIQRRGRARRAQSTYVLMFEEGDKEGSVEFFERREREMIEEYLDETRELVVMEAEKEEASEDDEGILGEGKKRKFLIESTGACLTLESAIGHLHHFCDCLPQGQYMNLSPIFTCKVEIESLTDKSGTKLITRYKAEVLLPNCISPKARRTQSSMSWPTEKWAKRDAALEAYIALYRLKLVDDHLMPLLRTDADIDAMKDVEKRPSKVPVDDTMNPWAEMRWDEDTIIFSTRISLHMSSSEVPVEIQMLTSVECPPVDDIAVYWTNNDVGKVVVGDTHCLGPNPDMIEWAKHQTHELLFNLFGSRMKMGVMEFPYLFVPLQPGDWDCSNVGKITNVLDAYNELGPTCDIVINDILQTNVRLIVRKWRTDIVPLEVPSIVERYGRKQIIPNQPIIEAVRVTRRRDFLHVEANQPASEATVLLLPQYCTLERIPWRFYQLGLFLPGIIRRIEIHLIAADLQRTLLAPVGINNLSLIVISLCTSAAREPIDYQRFEFLGDSVLKFLTSLNLVDEHPLWHEGYLARKKDQLVSNARLAKAAQDKRLPRWIINQIFTGVKWTPHYIQGTEWQKQEVKLGGKEPSMLSTKILADIVESLIGAAFLEGGYGKALECINLFIPENELKPLPTRVESMFVRADALPSISSASLRDLESLIGYEFNHKALLVEAITHPSYISDMSSVSYQRLEFLGDALLDMIVVPALFHHEKQLSHIDMHLFKASVVNAHFLAFLSLGYAKNVEDTGVESTRGRKGVFEVVPKDRKVELWKFVRHQHTEMAAAQKAVWHKYESEGFREKIQTSLDSDQDYPWTELYGLEADKFFSDIVEALLGAIFVDSGGDFMTVTVFAERLGVLKMMRRLVRDRVDVTHPVKKLGELVAASGQATVDYVPTISKGRHVCTVRVNQNTLVRVEGGSSRAEARVRAAEAGYHTLVQRKAEMGLVMLE